MKRIVTLAVIGVGLLIGMVGVQSQSSNDLLSLSALVETNPNQIKVRWSFKFDPATLVTTPVTNTGRVDRFPEGGFRLFRRVVNTNTWQSIGQFNLPASETAIPLGLMRGSTPEEKTANRAVLWKAIVEARKRQILSLANCTSPYQPPAAAEGANLDPTTALLLGAIDFNIAQAIGLAYIDQQGLVSGTQYEYQAKATWNYCQPVLQTFVLVPFEAISPAFPDSGSTSVGLSLQVGTPGPLPPFAVWQIDQDPGPPRLKPLDALKGVDFPGVKVRYYGKATDPDDPERDPRPVQLAVPVVRAAWKCPVLGQQGQAGGSCATPPSGLVSWWPMNDPTGATKVIDIWDGNTGTPLNAGGSIAPIGGGGPISIPGQYVGDSLNFGGPYVEVSNASNLNFGTSAFSIDAWVKVNPSGLGSTNNFIQPIVDKTAPTPIAIGALVSGYALFIYHPAGSTTGQLGFVIADGSPATQSPTITPLFHTTPLASAWYHVAVTVARPTATTATVTLYVNGVPSTSVPVTVGSTSNGASLWIGKSRLQVLLKASLREGGIDELEIFNRKLDKTEIEAIFKADKAGKCKPKASGVPPSSEPTGYYLPAGFNLWRSENLNGLYQQVNGFLRAPKTGGKPPTTPVIQFVPALVLPRKDDCTLTKQQVPQEIDFIDSSVEPDKTYYYALQSVDIFGRASPPLSATSEFIPAGPLDDPQGIGIRKIVTPTIDFPPIPPSRVCLNGLGNTAVQTNECGVNDYWTSTITGRQPDGKDKFDVQLKWQWGQTEEEARIKKIDRFQIYRAVNPIFPISPVVNPPAPVCPGPSFTLWQPPVPYNPNQPQGIYVLKDTLALQSPNDALSYYYYCITTVARNVDVNGNNIIESNEGVVESASSLPVMAVVVDKIKPQVACTNPSTGWRPFVKPNDIDPRPNYDGTVNVPVRWLHVPPPASTNGDVVGYQVYRSFDDVFIKIDPNQPLGPNNQLRVGDDPNLSNNAENISEAYLLLNRDLASPGLFVDKIEAKARNKFYYKLKAVDKAGNISDFSCASDPVALPPEISAPFIREIIGGNEEVTLRWTTNPLREEVQAYRIWQLKQNLTINSRDDARRFAQDPNNRQLVGNPVNYDPAKATAQPKQDHEGKVPAPAGQMTYYLVEAFRKVVLANAQFDLSAFSDPVAARAYDITPPKVPAKPTVALQSIGLLKSIVFSAVLVSWELPDPKDVEQMGIWRREGDSGPYVMIAPVFDKQKLFDGQPVCTHSNCSFLDKSVKSGTKYFYKIQVFDRFGNNAFSPESDSIGVP